MFPKNFDELCDLAGSFMTDERYQRFAKKAGKLCVNFYQ